jgi:hypothetical protein
MQEYSLMSPEGTPQTLRVEVGGRVALALPEGTIGYLGLLDARRLAHDLLDGLEATLEVRASPSRDGAQRPSCQTPIRVR